MFEKKSVLSINNSFYRVIQDLKDNRRNNKSTTKEFSWIQGQLLNKDSKICANAVKVLISGEIEKGLALNSLVSSLPRVTNDNYEIIANGMFELLVNVSRETCSFGVLQKPHPLLLLLENSSDKMLFLTHKIVTVLDRFKADK